MTSDFVAAFERLRHNDSSLTSLELFQWNKNKSEPEQTLELAAALQLNSTLTRLDVANTPIGEAGAAHLAAALQVNTSLTSFNLSINGIEDAGAAHLAAALQVNTSLTQLHVGRNGMGDAAASHLAAALQANSTLTSLNLSNKEIEAAQLSPGPTSLQQRWHTLRMAYLPAALSSNKIGDEGAAQLAAALRVNSTLTSLDLDFNRIGDEGAAHLAAALHVNSSLTSLHLARNEISEQGAAQLALALKYHPSLTNIALNFGGATLEIEPTEYFDRNKQNQLHRSATLFGLLMSHPLCSLAD